MKKKIQDEYMHRMQNSKLSPEEQAVMMAELNAKMASINDAISAEEEAQNASLQELLAKRRAKKEKLKGKMEVLAEKKQAEDEHYNKKLLEIAKLAEMDKNKIESELKNFRIKEEKEIAAELREKRADRLSA